MKHVFECAPHKSPTNHFDGVCALLSKMNWNGKDVSAVLKPGSATPNLISVACTHIAPPSHSPLNLQYTTPPSLRVAGSKLQEIRPEASISEMIHWAIYDKL